MSDIARILLGAMQGGVGTMQQEWQSQEQSNQDYAKMMVQEMFARQSEERKHKYESSEAQKQRTFLSDEYKLNREADTRNRLLEIFSKKPKYPSEQENFAWWLGKDPSEIIEYMKTPEGKQKYEEWKSVGKDAKKTLEDKIDEKRALERVKKQVNEEFKKEEPNVRKVIQETPLEADDNTFKTILISEFPTLTDEKLTTIVKQRRSMIEKAKGGLVNKLSFGMLNNLFGKDIGEQENLIPQKIFEGLGKQPDRMPAQQPLNNLFSVAKAAGLSDEQVNEFSQQAKAQGLLFVIKKDGSDYGLLDPKEFDPKQYVDMTK